MTRKALIRIMLVTLALAVLLAACASGPEKMDFTGLRSPDGGYVYPQLAWGASLDEAQEILGSALGSFQNSGQSPYTGGQTDQYGVRDAIQWDGCTGAVRYTFTEDSFTGVEYVFKRDTGLTEDDLNRLFDSMNEKLTGLYGEPEVYTHSSSDSHRWIHAVGEQTTGILLVKSYLAGTAQITLELCTWPTFTT